MARASAAEWAKRVKRWRRSGLTAKAYAAKYGLKASTLTYWSWRLTAQRRAAAAEQLATSPDNGALVEIEVVSAVPPIEIAFAHGACVRVPAGVDEATLATVVRLMEVAR